MAIFTNQALLTYQQGSANSNIVTGEIVEALTVTKTPLGETYTEDGNVVYLVNLRNSGSTAITGITLTDNLGAYPFGTGMLVPLTYVEGHVQYFINGVLQPAPVVSDLSPLTFTGISVPAGGNALVVYEAAVNEYAPGGSDASITNTVTATAPGLAPVSDSATVTAESGLRLAIIKSISPTTVSVGERLTYTFTVQNYGSVPAVATDDLSITDTFDPILTDITVDFEGDAWTEGVEYNYSEVTGLFTTVPGQITVPAATYTQDPVTGLWTVVPGEVVLRVVGTV